MQKGIPLGQTNIVLKRLSICLAKLDSWASIWECENFQILLDNDQAELFPTDDPLTCLLNFNTFNLVYVSAFSVSGVW